MLNVLSRLITIKSFVNIISKNHLKLNVFHIDYNYFFTQMQMNNTFHFRLIKTYVKDNK